MRWTAAVVVLAMLSGAGEAAVLCARKNGALKLREACKAKETLVDPVALGLQGPPGAAGPAGATGPSQVIITETQAVSGFTNTFTPVATLALEPGDYLLIGKTWLTDYNPVVSFQEYACRLVVGGDVGAPIDEASETLGQDNPVGIHSGTLVVTNTVSLDQTTAVDMRCANNGATQSSAMKVKLVAIRTAAITRQ